MRLARAVSVFLVTVGLSTAALGTAAVARDGAVAESYRELARQVAPAREDAAGEGNGGPVREEGVDWEVLLAQNPSAVAWLHVAEARWTSPCSRRRKTIPRSGSTRTSGATRPKRGRPISTIGAGPTAI